MRSCSRLLLLAYLNLFLIVAINKDGAAQSIQTAEEAYCAGYPDSTLAILQNVVEDNLSRSEKAKKLRLQGETYMLKGQWDLAKESFYKCIHETAPEKIEYPWQAWKHGMLARIAYWEIRPFEAHHHADSALYYLDLCKEKQITEHRLFKLWSIAVQAYKQYITEIERNGLKRDYTLVDSLSSVAISYLSDRPEFACYLAKAWHVRGNSFTDRIGPHRHTPLKSALLTAATEAYQQERQILAEAYGEQHVNIPMAWLTTIFANQYAEQPTEILDSLWRRGYAAYYPDEKTIVSRSRESEIMFLLHYNEFLFDNYDTLDSAYVFSLHEELDKRAWSSWYAMIRESGAKTTPETMAMYFLQPATLRFYAEEWKLKQGLPINIPLCFEYSQYLKYYDVLAEQTGTPLPKVKKLSDYQAELQQGELVLDFIYSHGDIAGVFAITRENYRFVSLPDTLTDAFRENRELLLTRDQAFAASGYKLYQTLLQLLPEIDTAELLTISLPHNMPLFPFEALVTSPPPSPVDYRTLDYLNNQCRIRYTLSAAFSTSPIKSNFKVSAFRPDYQSDAELPFAKKFQEDMQGEFSGWQTENQTDLDSCLAGDAEILHLSLHGRKTALRPKETALDVSGDLFTLDDIAGIPVSAHLVVVNACNSGEGRIMGMNGLEAPARRLMESGARAVISNAWEVDDQSSHAVLAAFYRELADGAPSDMALVNARRHYLQKASSSEAAHPFYWAASTHLGQPIIVSAQNKSLLSIIVIFSVGILLLYLYQSRLSESKRSDNKQAVK